MWVSLFLPGLFTCWVLLEYNFQINVYVEICILLNLYGLRIAISHWKQVIVKLFG